MERAGLLHQGDDEEAYEQWDLAALLAPEPTRWQQSESISQYMSFLWEDLWIWYENLDWQIVKEYIVNFLERFYIPISVSELRFFLFSLLLCLF